MAKALDRRRLADRYDLLDARAMSRRKDWNDPSARSDYANMNRAERAAYHQRCQDGTEPKWVPPHQYTGDLREAIETIRNAITSLDPDAPAFAQFLRAARKLSLSASDPGARGPVHVDRVAWNAFAGALAELRRR